MKLLDGLPIVLGEPSVCDQFDHLHKEGVPIVGAQTRIAISNTSWLAIRPRRAGGTGETKILGYDHASWCR
jgi:hypothetical protein